MERYRTYLSAGCLLLLLALWVAPAQAYTFGGRAYAAMVSIPLLGGPTYIGDTGALAADGGWEGATVPSAQVPSVLTADVVVAATSGATYDTGPAADAFTSLADVVVFPGHLAQLTASFVRAQVQSTASGLQGISEIAGLAFGGVAVTVTGQPNQTVTIPGVATLVINEQAITSNPTSQTIRVNALHLRLVTGEEIVLSSATSSINW